ncbi:amino acid ABC transporter permease [Treponema sp.]|uniref:amino acid ABC transporter permease n=1 Tax=Treponema sp. TaxID=166 RepID=UPI00298DDF82|nr:amino acid ABC transporter permease [Treponema sp.]
MNGTDKIADMLKVMMQGTVISLQAFIFTLLFAVPLAALICAGRMSKLKVVKYPIQLLLLIVRGTPLMLQLITVYFVLPMALSSLGIKIDRFVAAVIALSINYACYFAEIYRGGFESISHGQYEACTVLGYNRWQTFIHIICPQVIKRIVPAMGNETMTLVKDTALVNVIGISELLIVSKKMASSMANILPLFIAGAFYLLMNAVVAFAFNKLEKKLSYYK